MKFSCYGCDKRSGDCHAKCEKYKKEREEYDKLMDAERKRKDTKQGLKDQRTAAVGKAVRHWRRWK